MQVFGPALRGRNGGGGGKGAFTPHFTAIAPVHCALYSFVSLVQYYHQFRQEILPSCNSVIETSELNVYAYEVYASSILQVRGCGAKCPVSGPDGC